MSASSVANLIANNASPANVSGEDEDNILGLLSGNFQLPDAPVPAPAEAVAPAVAVSPAVAARSDGSENLPPTEAVANQPPPFYQAPAASPSSSGGGGAAQVMRTPAAAAKPRAVRPRSTPRSAASSAPGSANSAFAWFSEPPRVAARRWLLFRHSVSAPLGNFRSLVQRRIANRSESDANVYINLLNHIAWLTGATVRPDIKNSAGPPRLMEEFYEAVDNGVDATIQFFRDYERDLFVEDWLDEL